jgi:hypothetical protein
MQAENTYAVTLRSRPLLPFNRAIALGAAIVAGAVFVATHVGSLQPWQADAPALQSPSQQAKPRAEHPFGALVFFAPEAAPTPARKPSSFTRGAVLEIDPQLNGAMQRAPAQEVVAQDAPAQRDADAEQVAPLPPRRPQSATDLAQQNAPRGKRDAQPAIAAAAPDDRGFFERMFNIQPKEQGTALAYASPQDGAVSGSMRGSAQQMPMGYADGRTAVYDISAKTVFMPNGEKLEAHSGLGDLLDDPNRVHVKNRGATPPNVYDLTLRESLFHGVRALRLNPLNGSEMYGRDGMLAHTYMLGPKGDSNGCVSFKDYERFLNAYLNGEVKRLIVVQRRA